jgi:hypothetical protein
MTWGKQKTQDIAFTHVLSHAATFGLRINPSLAAGATRKRHDFYPIPTAYYHDYLDVAVQVEQFAMF